MRRLSLLRLLPAALALLIPAGTASAGEPGSAARRIGPRLDRVLLGHDQAGVVFGGRVVELPSGRVLYDRDGHRPLLPASNMKLVVMAAAIDRLDEGFSFETVLAVRGTDLVVIGGGDPTFGDERLARRRGETITAVFHSWADALKAAGVKQIPGDLLIDDSILDRQFVHPNWPADQFQKWYEAPVGGLNFNANCTAVRVRPTTSGKPAEAGLVPGNGLLRIINKAVTGGKDTATIRRKKNSDTIVVSGSVIKGGVYGPVSVRDPGLYFGHVLKTVLAAEGIRVAGGVVRERVRRPDGTIPKGCHIIAVHRSPLTDALSRAGKESLGMVAEAMIKLLGHHRSSGTGVSPVDMGSWANGRLAVADFLGKVGVPAAQFTIDEGSGLSRANRLSPAAATEVLRYMFKAPGGAFETLRDGLARGGVDGTMRKRCRWPETKGRIYAKTGYINGVRTLAGYIHTTSDRWLAFAFFYNQAVTSVKIKGLQDDACRLLVHWPDVR